MKKPLLDILFASGKRKSILLLLQHGAKEVETLLSFMDTSRTTLLPQMKILEDYHLVTHYKDIYELTIVGRLLVEKMEPLSKTLEVLDVDVSFWGNHDLSFIPPDLLSRIRELGECRIMSPPLEMVHEADADYIEASTLYHYSITTFFYPNFQEIFTRMLSKGASINVIISQSLFRKLKTDSYSDMEELLSNNLVHFSVYPGQMNLHYFVFSEQYLLISPLKNNRDVDNRFVFCKDPDAIDWAKEVFEYYLKGSAPITHI